MNTIPPDIHESVGELVASIALAVLAEDCALAESFQQQLHSYCHAQLAAGRNHPFLLETLGDFTDDPAQAFCHYQQALEMSRGMNTDEPTHSILIGLGEQLIEMKQFEQAEAFIRDGRTEAVRRKEPDWIKNANKLLQQFKT